MDTDQALVAENHACPFCGERDQDKLAWIDDATVRCECGKEYMPGRVAEN